MDLQDELKLTYLFIAHDLSVVRHISDRVGVMYLGRLVEVAPSEQLFSNPQHPYTQGLMAAVPVRTQRSKAARPQQLIVGEVPSVRRPPKGCRFHPRCPIVRDECRERVPELRSRACEFGGVLPRGGLTLKLGRTVRCRLRNAGLVRMLLITRGNSRATPWDFHRIRLMIVGCFLLGLTPDAHALRLSVEILKCAEIDVRLERLQCFDGLADVVANSKVVSIPVEDLSAPVTPAEDGFGLKGRRGYAGVSGTIKELAPLARGRHQFTLDNDQVWQEIEPKSRARYAVGDVVTIEKTMMGAYLLRVEATGFTNKVKRLR